MAEGAENMHMFGIGQLRMKAKSGHCSGSLQPALGINC
jgi:hypothetical protein